MSIRLHFGGSDNLISRCSCDESSCCSSNRTFSFYPFAKQAEIVGKVIIFFSVIFICFFALVCLYPFAWMFFSTFKTNREIYQPTFFPQSYEWDAFYILLTGQTIPFVEYFLNSLMFSGMQAFLATVVCSAAGLFLPNILLGEWFSIRHCHSCYSYTKAKPWQFHFLIGCSGLE